MWVKFARAIYTSGTPFTIVENVYWIEFFKLLKLSFTLPSRKTLSGSLLDSEYKRVSKVVNHSIKSAVSYALQIDSWSNVRYMNINDQ